MLVNSGRIPANALEVKCSEFLNLGRSNPALHGKPTDI
jgi:hypothetical protein